MHPQGVVVHSELAGLLAHLRAESRDRGPNSKVRADAAGEVRGGRAGDAYGLAGGAQDPQRFLQVLPTDAVEHKVVVLELLLEVLAAVVDHDVGAKVAHEIGVGTADGGGDGR